MRQTGTPFVGREAELAAIGPLLATRRVLTFTGAGGSGKSRLAIEAARRAARRSPTATFLVELADVASGESLTAALLDAVGARGDPGREPLATVSAQLSGGPALLIVDNCEHLVSEAGELIAALIERCPELRVVATSRQPLGLDGEETWAVPPMSTPALDAEVPLAALVESDAGRLFVASAARNAPGFALTPEVAPAITQICERLDGMPLAISLAAAHIGDSTPEEILAGLADRFRLLGADGDHRPAQQRGLRASLAWSYGLLDPAERLLFRRLAALIGASAADALAVCEPASSLEAVRTRIERLAEWGLLRVDASAAIGDSRYGMLETVREYALERLVEAGEEDEARDRHLERFGEVAAAANDLLNDPRGRRRLDLDSANLHAALDRATRQDASAALAICQQLTYYWFAADRFEEGRAACARALAAAGDADPLRRALVLRCAALLATAVEDYAEAHVLATAGLTLARESEDGRAIGLCLQATNLALGTVDPRGAAETGREAVALLRRPGGDRDLGHALMTLAVAEALRDRFAAFDALRAEFMAIPAAREDEWLRVLIDLHAAWAAITRGDPRSALEYTEDVLERIGEEVSLRATLARAHRLQAMALGGEADSALAEGLERIEMARRTGAEVGALTLETAVATAELAVGDLDSVTRRAESSLDAPALHAVVFWRESLARIALERGEPALVAEHAAAIRTVGSRTGSPRQAALADQLDGSAALRQGEISSAADLLHAALTAQAEHGCRRDAADTLEELGLLAAHGADNLRAARLTAASAAARRSLGCVRIPAEATDGLSPSAEPETAQALRARAEGERLSLAEAIAYAGRSRGKRERAAGGWASLTPAEAEAAKLAAAGLSNPEIAARLFMSRGTVKAHLSRAYGKLEVANRTELAALAGEAAASEE